MWRPPNPTASPNSGRQQTMWQWSDGTVLPDRGVSGFAGTARFVRRAALTFLAAALSSGLASRAEAEALAPLSRRLVYLRPPPKAPALQFYTAAGKKQTLADYHGDGVILNIWATWCVPCQAEMPALDHLATLVAHDRIAVLPVSVDTAGLKVVQAFYSANHITHVPILLDPSGSAATALKVPGVPTTIIVDRQGRIVGGVAAAVKWDAPASIALLRRMLGQAK